MSRTRPSEYWSEELANSNGKPDANLANNALQLGGIEAEDYATKRYVQDYHNSKEELLKEYIDSQDLAKLQAAKDYVDTMIRNQDFSSFAKITDLQTLSENLSTRIEACKLQCQQELNTRLAAVVSDVNENFEDVNATITNLNNATNELFTSVSNGKQVVAAAITDKGVQTASDATYNTMANHIRQIPTGGGGTDTSDATAYASDIVVGKTAYARGSKIYGTFIAQAAEGYPTYGTDTSNATVSAEDITFGKTAYSNGEYITGTANPVNPEVEEIYVSSGNNYDISESNIGLTTYPDTQDEVTARYAIEFSKDGNYCVSAVSLNGNTTATEFCIESHQVTNDGLIINASADVSNGTIYKKYRYTKEELGIDADEEISSIKLSAAGFLGYSTRCLLLIRTYSSETSKYYFHIYTYHLNDNGVIGKEYMAENYVIVNNKIEDTTSISTFITGNNANIIFANTDSTVFYVIRNYSSGSIYSYKTGIQKNIINPTLNSNMSVNINIVNGVERSILTTSNPVGVSNLQITSDDKFILTNASSNTHYASVIRLNDLEVVSGYTGQYQGSTVLMLEQTEQLIHVYGNRFVVSENSSWSQSKSINLKYDDTNTQYTARATLTGDGSKLIVLTTNRSDTSYVNSTSMRLAIFNVDDILNANQGENVLPIQYERLLPSNAYSGNSALISTSAIQLQTTGNKVQLCIEHSVAELWTTYTNDDTRNLIGVIYKNHFFRNTESGLLSATASDVANGKTFIGYDGTVQTGTLETSTEENSEIST